ncbi:MAG: 5-formyltetrahydrofolate cyclo-ligase [Clostridia bacterium]|nr:5-formyltetrahydrofolate cyclo-ligase [Clostridia bacterium]
MSVTKNELRKEMKNRRNSIANRVRKNRLIFQRLKQLLLHFNVDSIFIYVSFGTETDTHEIIRQFIKSGKSVCIPYTDSGTMSVKTLHALPENFAADKQGNIECAAYLPDAEFKCDCAIVPMLAFNDGLYRLGYGGGYYDRFLRDFEGIKIGIAFDEQYNNDFTEEETDVGLDIIVSPERIFQRKEIL